jgi:GT2 family glycosyltransferase
MDVSIIIVNWNSAALLKKCLLSIYRSTAGIAFEVIIIDNASYDGCKEMIYQEFPTAIFIQSDKNLGFAKANNTAFNIANGRNVLFLNPDTEIEGIAVETLNQQLDSLPNAGIVGARLLNSDRSVQTTCIRAFPTILNQLLDCNALRKAFPNASLWGTSPLFATGNAPAVVDAVSGACLMMKKSVLETVGMFSTDYFMYSEDIDLCFTVKKAGLKTYYVPMAVIIHHGGMSSSQSRVNSFSSVMMLESRWRFFRKSRSYWHCWVYRFVMCFASIIRIGLAVLVWPIYVLKGREGLIGDVMKKWYAKLRWTLGGEDWVKSY